MLAGEDGDDEDDEGNFNKNNFFKSASPLTFERHIVVMDKGSPL